MSDETAQAKNTDRELYREPDKGNGSFYSDSIHVTEEGGIGIDCGGTVLVKPLREWHRLALAESGALPPKDGPMPPVVMKAPRHTRARG